MAGHSVADSVLTIILAMFSSLVFASSSNYLYGATSYSAFDQRYAVSHVKELLHSFRRILACLYIPRVDCFCTAILPCI
jgi:hypothetical protein